jgi:hypothetical protein
MHDFELHIERLVLHDVPGHQRHRIAAAITAELVRLVTEQGLPPHMVGAISIDLPAADITVPVGARPEAIGQQVALALYQSLGGTPAASAPSGRAPSSAPAQSPAPAAPARQASTGQATPPRITFDGRSHDG